MPKRWERELHRLSDVPAPIDDIRARSERPSAGHAASLPPARQRVVAGVVAFGVFLAAAAFGWQAFSGGEGAPAGPAIDGDWPAATITLTSDGSGKSASLSIGGRTQRGEFGASTSPDEPYPYVWSNPQIGRAIAVPIGAELRVDGDVHIKEVLYGNADELDAGKAPDSGPISSEQPTFREPYFPVQDQTRREYWKLFGTWADGSVLDVYFEVRWVEPRVDLTDTSVDIVLAPETLEAELLYGGQRLGTMGDGSYGGMSVILEWVGYDADTVYFPVAAGSTIDVVGDDLESWTTRVERRQGAESFEAIDRIPDAMGPTTLRLSVVWGDGSGTFRFPVEIVEPRSTTDAEPAAILEQIPPRSFAGETLDGRPLDLGDFQDRAIIAVAWESSCAPCRATLNRIQTWTEVSRLGPVAVGIVERADADKARRTARDLGVSFPNVIARDDRDRWGIDAMPSVWVMAPDGTVVAFRSGSVDRGWLADAVYRAAFGAASEPTETSSSDVLRVRCTDEGVEILTPEVEAQAEGVHVLAEPGSAEHAEAIELRPLGWPMVNFSSSSSGVHGEFARQVPPGDVIVACVREGDTGRLTVDPRPTEAVVRVTDPNGFFTPWIPTCPLEQHVAFDAGDPVPTDASEDMDDTVRRLLVGLSPPDSVAPAGYLRAHPAWDPLFSVTRSGEVIGSVWVERDDGEARITSGFACAGSGVEEGLDPYPAWQG